MTMIIYISPIFLESNVDPLMSDDKILIHNNITHPCNICDYKATQKGSLERHKRSVHDKVKYPCN